MKELGYTKKRRKVRETLIKLEKGGKPKIWKNDKFCHIKSLKRQRSKVPFHHSVVLSISTAATVKMCWRKFLQQTQKLEQTFHIIKNVK